MNHSRQKLSQQEIRNFLRELPEWALEEEQLVRFWTFPNFAGAMSFVKRVARLAEEANHHPDIDIRYNRVKLALSSHDAGGLTVRDIELAHRLSASATGRAARKAA